MKNTHHIKPLIWATLWFIAVMWKVRKGKYIPVENAIGAFRTAWLVFAGEV